MQDTFAQSKAHALLESVTVGDLFRMIDSAQAKHPDSADRANKAYGLILNTLGIMTSGHTVPDKPPFSEVLGAILDTVDEKRRGKLILSVISVLADVKSARE